MLPCNQTKDFTVSLFGDTLPKYILYGKVHNKIFTCDYFTGKYKTPDGRKAYFIKLRDNKRNFWKPTETIKHPDIFIAIENYVRTNTINGERIEVCQHKHNAKKVAFYAAKRSENTHARRVEREVNKARHIIEECGCPKVVRAQSYAGCNSVQRSKIGNVECEKVWIDYDNPKPIPADYWDRGYNQPFEMGQNTSGNKDGAYTRSGFEVKRDGLKIDPTKIRPNDKPDYMRKSGQPRSLSEAQQIALLKNKDEVWYNHNCAKSEGIKSLKQCAIKED